MTPSLADRIADAIRTGTPPLITVEELLAEVGSSEAAVARIGASFAEAPLALASLYRLAALVPGVPIGAYLPEEGVIAPIFDRGVAALESVNFALDVRGEQILAIECALLLAADSGGVTLAVLDQPAVRATVKHVHVRVTRPLSPPPLVDVAIDGRLALGALVLDLTIAAPSLTLSARQLPEPPLALPALLESLGLPLAERFDGLWLDDLSLDIDARGRNAYLEVVLDTGDDTPFPLVPGVLALDRMSLVVEHAPGNTAATITADLVVRESLHMGVLIASDGESGSWRLEGGLDVPATAAALGKERSAPVTVSDLLTRTLGLALPGQLESFLGGIDIWRLGGEATIAKGDTRYALFTEFSADWQLAENLVVATRTSIEVDDGGATITADFDIGGFALSLGYQASAQASTRLSARAPQLAGLEGAYDLGQGTLSLSFARDARTPTLGELVADFIGLVTGRPFVTLPAPWDALGRVGLALDKLGLSVDLARRAIAIEYRDPGMFSLLGGRIDGFALRYEADKKRGQRLAFKLLGDLRALTGTREPEFDPEKPSTAPAVSGYGRARMDVRLLALGQHVVLPPGDTASVTRALAGIARMARASGDDAENLPGFSHDAGWLIGAHLVMQGAIDVQMVFADPSIYGLLVEVKKPAPPARGTPALAALVGLRAEILYRRITETLGVYQGFLTLPDRVRRIDFGAFQFQLPSLAVAIYTNGDFLVDVGFPHGGDFSRSAMVTAGPYTGAGGVYYGRLSGETATQLPPVPTDGAGNPLGIFDPVTTIGIGVRVGIVRGFRKGPLSARASMQLQAIFEGTFATYTQFADQQTDEYYDVRAAISIIGELEGAIDFAIIKASVLIRIEVTIGVRAIAARQIEVPVSARVTVRVSIRIDLGLFAIHIHLSFQATVGFTITMGANRHALWHGPRPLAAFARAQAAVAAASLSLEFEPLPVGLDLPLYLVPQLTRGTTDAGPRWIYTMQLALAAPQAVPGAENAPGDGHQFVDFVALVAAWVGNAAFGDDAEHTGVDEVYASIALDGDRARAISEALHGARTTPGARPTVDDIRVFLARSRFSLGFPDASAGPVGLGFFPMVPGATVGFALGQGEDAEATEVAGDDGRRGQVLRDYILLIALQVFDRIEGLFAADESPQQRSLAECLATLGPAMASAIVAMTTRFMLHGTRVDDGRGGQQALYRATGQEFVPGSLEADAMSATLGHEHPESWGLVFAEGATSITLTSAAGQLHAPSAIAGFPDSVSEAGMAAGPMASVVTAMRRYGLLEGTAGADACIRRLSRELVGLLQEREATDFQLFGEDGQALSRGFAWCTTVPFDIRRVPDPAQGAGAGAGQDAWLARTYAIAGVQSDGLDALEAVYREQTDPGGGPAITRLELAFTVVGAGHARSLTLVPVEPSRAFLFQSNLSTRAEPGALESGAAVRAGLAASVRARAMESVPDIDPDLDFLGRLLGAGLGAPGGHFLYLDIDDGGVPAELFDERGLARLSAVISFATRAQGDRLRRYYTAARLDDASLATTALYAGSVHLTTERASVPPGMVGAQVTRPAPVDTASYQSSLDHLFNLIGFDPARLVDAEGVATDLAMTVGPAIGPVEPERPEEPEEPGAAATDALVYRHVFDLLALVGVDRDATSLAEESDPYRFVGGQLILGHRWIDLYGHTLPCDLVGEPLPIHHTDPLNNLGDWPGLAYGFRVEGGDGAPRVLVLESTWVPPSEDTAEPLSDDARARYATTYHQLATCRITASSSLCDAVLEPVPDARLPHEILRGNIEQILGSADANEPLSLDPLRFALPEDDAAYRGDLLLPLRAAISFERHGDADPDFSPEARAAILSARSELAPFHPTAPRDEESRDQGALFSYRGFAQDFEAAFASLGLRVLAGSLDVPGAAQLFALRWGDGGISVRITAATGDGARGHAPPPLATSLQSRARIQPLVNKRIPRDNPFTLPDAPLEVVNLDMDAALADFVTAVDRFLSPDHGVPAARLDRAALDRCIAAKQVLARALADRVVALDPDATGNESALVAARERYRQACLGSLASYYAVDAVAVLEVETTAPAGAALPRLAIHGQLVQDEDSGDSDVSASSGQASLERGTTTTMAVALTARNKGWQASYQVPQRFAIEALERITGTISVATSDQPVVNGVREERPYRTGEWLRFVLDHDTRQRLDGPAVELPLRAYPPTPVLHRQGFSAAAMDGAAASTSLASAPIQQVKSWALEAGYRHTYAAQDTLHLTVVLNERPASMFAARALRGQDLLDALAQFQALYPRLESVFDTQLAAGVDSDEVRAAMDAFVVLVEYVRDHLAFVPERTAVGSAPTGHGETWEFTVEEGFEGDPATAPFEVRVAQVRAPELAYQLPPPVFAIAGYESHVHAGGEGGAWTYRFRDSEGHALTAADAVATPERALAITPLDIIDWQNGRVYLQVVRNQGLPGAFVYTTPVVGARARVSPLVERTVDLDIAALPRPEYGPDGPAEGSLLDWSARLFHILLAGQADEDFAHHGSIRAAVSLSWPMAGSLALPRVRLPIVLTLPQALDFDPTPDEAVALARPLSDAVGAWLAEREVTREGRPELHDQARLDFEVTVFSEGSDTGMPILRLDGLMLATRSLAE